MAPLAMPGALDYNAPGNILLLEPATHPYRGAASPARLFPHPPAAPVGAGQSPEIVLPFAVLIYPVHLQLSKLPGAWKGEAMTDDAFAGGAQNILHQLAIRHRLPGLPAAKRAG